LDTTSEESGGDGTLRTVELYGPNNLGTWPQSYNVLLTVLVMIDAVDLGHLQKYRAHIERMAERYGTRVLICDIPGRRAMPPGKHGADQAQSEDRA